MAKQPLPRALMITLPVVTLAAVAFGIGHLNRGQSQPALQVSETPRAPTSGWPRGLSATKSSTNVHPESPNELFGRFEKTMQTEGTDLAWSAATTQKIKEEFGRLSNPGAQLKEVKCATTLCRMVIKNESRESQNKLPFAMTHGVFANGMSFSYRPEKLETIAWVHREGRDRPR